jgi:hypothetical protein
MADQGRPVHKSKEQYQELLTHHVSRLSSLQQLLYASNRYATLLVFQAVVSPVVHPKVAHAGDAEGGAVPAQLSSGIAWDGMSRSRCSRTATRRSALSRAGSAIAI